MFDDWWVSLAPNSRLTRQARSLNRAEPGLMYGISRANREVDGTVSLFKLTQHRLKEQMTCSRSYS